MTFLEAAENVLKTDMSFGNCHIVARPVLSPEVARQCGDVLSGADVICSQPDDLHYELEPTDDFENETKGVQSWDG